MDTTYFLFLRLHLPIFLVFLLLDFLAISLSNWYQSFVNERRRSRSPTMANQRFEVEKFDGTGDYGLWKLKIKVVLVQRKALIALEETPQWPTGSTEKHKQNVLDNAHSIMILHLSDNVLRQITNEDTALKIWRKLDSIYMAKDLSNKIYVKEKLFTFKMNPQKSLTENLDEFKKLTIDFNSLGEEIGDENESILLLNSLPEDYREVKAAMKYGRERLSVSTVRSKELELNMDKRDSAAADSLYAHGNKRTNTKNSRFPEKSKNKSKLKVFLCHKDFLVFLQLDFLAISLSNTYTKVLYLLT